MCRRRNGRGSPLPGRGVPAVALHGGGAGGADAGDLSPPRRGSRHRIARSFHEGYLDSLPAADPFDAATCLLVSHFLLENEARASFFRQIAARLQPGGYLVSADLASDMTSPAYRSLLEMWKRMFLHCGVPPEKVEQSGAEHGRDVAVLPPSDIAAIISSGGFNAPTLFFQTLLIHAWYARRM